MSEFRDQLSLYLIRSKGGLEPHAERLVQELRSTSRGKIRYGVN